jgi:hypothetical protein
MSRTVRISEEVAALLEERQKRAGYPSLDETAEAFIVRGMANDVSDDHSAGHTDDELRALIDEADASGESIAWDTVAVKGRGAAPLRRPRARVGLLKVVRRPAFVDDLTAAYNLPRGPKSRRSRSAPRRHRGSCAAACCISADRPTQE